MHDVPLNQAVGLLGLAAPLAPQLLAVVSHGDARTEQPLLWQLSSALSELGYSVTVLDATMSETVNNPGLQQLLDYQFGHSALEDDGPAWNVLPAAMGLQSLCAPGAKPAHSLQRLGQALQSSGVLVLYAGSDVLIRLLGGSTVRPLLSVSGEKSSLLTSYLALKRLLRKGRLEPTILNMMQDAAQGTGAAGVAHALRECARNFLAYDVRPVRIDPLQPEAHIEADMRRLVTRLLEHAMPLPCGTAQEDAGFEQSAERPRERVRFGEMSRSH
ncbi:hypothetical protein DIC66_20485 [Rhodoferax lacus]|uniref:Uncharacterized protein n=1 Tax=Rhodoferax lacus TaxID=2184758 RepID=A0A3E1R776_9BURK|nr:hypothetical protein [Rhodoferax lacus]RFO95041.1 hypothetical protein DIC66_20485 [Rhodoferax lacus]